MSFQNFRRHFDTQNGLKNTVQYINFRLALALNEHGLKMPVLANTLFYPQFSFSQHFEKCDCSLPRFLYDTQFLTMFYKWLHVFIQKNNAQR